MKQTRIRRQNRLRELRKLRGLSQYEIASRLKIPRTTYANWEQGICTPRLEMALKLAKLLGVSIEKLFDL
ncbi:MAG: helix-turn-helix transcriptional regulator [Thermotoga sp.]|nr:helix-turn-helix transcriptional regulator [Thermotoga sp.]